MKARLIRPAMAHNVRYDITANPVKWYLPDGVVVGSRWAPTFWHDGAEDGMVQLPVGTVIEDSEVWRLCCWQFGNDPPFAEPADDECHARVELSDKNRPEAIEQIADWARQADRSSAVGRYAIRLAVAYGLQSRDTLEID